MSRLTEQRQRLNFRLEKSAIQMPRLFAMTDETRGNDPIVLAGRLPAGAGLIFRHYGDPNRHEMARQIVKICQKRGIFCSIAGNTRLALAVGADGVHLPERMVSGPHYGLNHFRNRGGRLTCAAHSRAVALAAAKLGVDGVFVSPVFATQSHPDTKALGIIRFGRLIQRLDCPVYALGGQSRQAAARVLSAGAYGIAGIDLFRKKTCHVDSRKIG